MQTLRSFLITNIENLTDDTYENICQHFDIRMLKRNEILARPGNIIRELFFVNKGCIRTHDINDDGSEFTYDFAFAGSLQIIPSCFLYQKACDIYVQAIEPSELSVISYDKFDYLSKTIPMFYYSLLFFSYWKSQEFLRGMRRQDAFGRYKWLLQNRPQIIQKISDKLIASYLGIDIRTLMRVKSKIRNNN